MGAYDYLKNYNDGQNTGGKLDYGFLKNYAQGGINQLDEIQKQITATLGGNTPGNNQELYNNLMGGYENSPDTQYKINKMMNYNRNAHAAGGTAGGGYNRFDDLSAINQLTSQGAQQYFQNKTGLYNTGLGLSQNVMGNGLNASNSILNGQLTEAQMAQQQAQFDQQQEAQNPSWLSAGITALGNYVLPGIGGQIGNAAGNYASKLIGKVGGNTSNPGLKDLMQLKNMGFFK